MAKTIKTYEKEKSPLYQLRRKEDLCKLLYVSSYEQLEQFASDVDNYNPFENSKGRQIEAPLTELKKIQQHFNCLLQRIIVPDFVKAGIKGSCHINNAQAHRDGKYFYKTDIKKFFPSTRREKVFLFLLCDMKMKKSIAFILSNILTYENHLPTGSPSSQLLTYWAYRKMFEDIHQKAQEFNITMTLFVDNLTFSGDTEIHKIFTDYVKSRLETEELRINKKKSRKYSSISDKKVTGVVITPQNKLEVPHKQCAKIRCLMKKPDKTQEETESLKGLLSATRQIEPSFMNSYYKKVVTKSQNALHLVLN